MERESRRMIRQGSHESHEWSRMITKPLIIRVNLSDSCDSWLLAEAQTRPALDACHSNANSQQWPPLRIQLG